MRIFTTTLLLLLLFFFSSCNNPQQLVKASNYQRGYELSKKRLDQSSRKNMPAQEKDLAALLDSYLALQSQSIQELAKLEQQPIETYEKYSEMLVRVIGIKPYAENFEEVNYDQEFSSIQEKKNSAGTQAGKYCYKMAEQYFDEAQAYQKEAAQIAHTWLIKAVEYVPQELTYHQQLEEMKDLGTTRIAVFSIEENDDTWNSIQEIISSQVANKKGENWIEIIYGKTKQRLDYEAQLHLEGLQITLNEEQEEKYTSFSTQSPGRMEEPMTTQDSTATHTSNSNSTNLLNNIEITSIKQLKSAWGKAKLELISVANTEATTKDLSAHKTINWSNTYEICVGNRYDSEMFTCKGEEMPFPNDVEMVEEIVTELGDDLINQLVRYIRQQEAPPQALTNAGR